MTTQDEWRQIKYQQDLGEQGKPTGTSVNAEALKVYQDRQNQNQTSFSPPSPLPAPPEIMVPPDPIHFPEPPDPPKPSLGEGLGFPGVIWDPIPPRKSLYDQFVEICWWVVTKIPPLLWIVEVADKLEQSSRLFRIAVATFSAAGFLLYVLIQNPWKNLEPWVLLITAAIGALVGWFLPPVLAFAMALAVYLVVLGLLAVTSVFVIWFVYRVIFYPS